MAVTTRIDDIRYFSEYQNGESFSLNPSDYSAFLNSNILERGKIEIDIVTGVSYRMNSNGGFIVTSGPNDGYLYQPGVDWKAEGFYVGASVRFLGKQIGVEPYVVEYLNEGTVTSIFEDEMHMTLTVNDLPTPESYPFESGTDPYVSILTANEGLEFMHNFIENNDSFNVLNKFTNTEQRFLFDNLQTGIPDAGVPADPTNKAWITGDVTVTGLGGAPNDYKYIPQNTFQKYTVEIEVINPYFYKYGERNNVLNIEPPADFIGDKSQKLVFKTAFKNTLSNSNTLQEYEYDFEKGNTGWFNESGNGFPNNYTLESIVYENLDTAEVVDNIYVGVSTRVTCVITDSESNFSNPQIVIPGHVKLLDRDEYEKSNREWADLWLFDSKRQTSGAGAISSDLVENVTCTVDSTSQITVVFEINFNADQISRIENEDYYVLFCHIQTNTADNSNHNRVCLQLDVNQYFVDTDVPGLITEDYIDLYNLPNVWDSAMPLEGYTSLKLWNESIAFQALRFALNTPLSPVINKLEFLIVAYNPTTKQQFTIQSYVLDPTNVTVSGVQQFNLDTTRGYNLPDGETFNLVKFTNDGSAAGQEFYLLEIGFKVNWQFWLELLSGVDTIFFNSGDEFNGFNQRTSNYSLQNGYEIRTALQVTCFAEEVNTIYQLLSPTIEVTDFNNEPVGNDNWDDCYYETFKTDAVTNLNKNILTNENTIIKATLVPNVAITDETLYWGVIRVEETRQGGFNDYEINSERAPLAGSNPLIPLDGETFAKLSLESGNLVIEAQLDFTKLVDGASYSISFEADLKEPAAITGAYSIGYNKQAYN